MTKSKSKLFNRPRKTYDSVRIKSEHQLAKKYGLKSMREIWKADFAISGIRNRAKKLITADVEQQEKFIEMQKKKGFKVESITDILALNKEDYLKRRLQSILVEKKLCRTPGQARQVIVHKQVTIDGEITDAPSHLTTLEDENKIRVNVVLPIKEEKKESIEIKPSEEENSEE